MELLTIFFALSSSLIFSICHGIDPNSVDHIAQLTHSLDILNQTVGQLIRENGAYKNETSALKGEVAMLTSGNGALKNEVEVLKQEVAALKASSANTAPVVAFHASLTSSISNLGNKQIIRFDKVLSNEGNAYDSRVGHFTSPVRGLYMFSMSIMSLPGDHIHAEMVKNGNAIASVLGVTPDYDAATDVVLVSLDTNDVVWVRNSNSVSHGVYGGGYSTFSGYLINKL